MPTGYTSDVGEKNISFRKYAMNCARAFGALVEMRDSPLGAKIPTKFKPHSYNLEQLEKAKQTLQTAKNMTDTQATAEAERLYDQSLQGYANSLKKTATTTERYVGMRAKAKEWQAPTPDHEGLRDFMISQLEQSIDFDCSIHSEVPKRMTPEEYKDMIIERAQRDIEYHEEQHQK